MCGSLIVVYLSREAVRRANLKLPKIQKFTIGAKSKEKIPLKLCNKKDGEKCKSFPVECVTT